MEVHPICKTLFKILWWLNFQCHGRMFMFCQVKGKKEQFRKKYTWYTYIDACIENDLCALRPQYFSSSPSLGRFDIL